MNEVIGRRFYYVICGVWSNLNNKPVLEEAEWWSVTESGLDSVAGDDETRKWLLIVQYSLIVSFTACLRLPCSFNEELGKTQDIK